MFELMRVSYMPASVITSIKNDGLEVIGAFVVLVGCWQIFKASAGNQKIKLIAAIVTAGIVIWLTDDITRIGTWFEKLGGRWGL